MKILVDMNLSPLWVPFLRQQGFEAIHWADIGASTAPDAEIMEYAAVGGFVILTHDLDFGRLLAIGQTNRPSVIQMRSQDVMPAAMGNVLVVGLHATREQLDSGALVTIDVSQHRIRLLPIR